jgi:hypothetical protein
MAQPQESRITCGQCNGWYNSETELRNHMQTVHRRFVPEQSTFQHGGTQPDSFEDQLGTVKGKMGQTFCTVEELSPSPLQPGRARRH